jgi:uncharacterized protein (DUF433 family)
MSDPTTVVHSDPEILGGAPVFVGTRVPFQNLIDYLAGGDSLDEFLRQFPCVKREQAQAALGSSPLDLDAIRTARRRAAHSLGRVGTARLAQSPRRHRRRHSTATGLGRNEERPVIARRTHATRASES